MHVARKTFLTALAALPATTAPALSQTSRTPLRISTAPVDGGSEPYYAQELGFFADAGFDVQIVPQPSGAVGITSVVAGAVDIALSSVVQMASALLHGINLQYVAPGYMWDTSAAGGALIVGTDSGIQSARGFEGKTIAVSALRDVTHLAALAYLIKGGADPEKVTFVETTFPTMIPAVSAGRVAGAVTVVPFVPAAGDGTRILSSGFGSIADRYMLVGFFASTPWIQANRATVRRFADVMRNAARWGNDRNNHPRSALIIEKYTKTLATTTERLVRATYGETLDQQWVSPPLDWEYRVKWTERRVLAREMIAIA